MNFEDPFAIGKDSRTQKLIFYIPSKRSDNTELGILLRAQACHSVMNFLLRRLGGATMVEAKGYYNDDKGFTHSETTTLCISYFQEEVRSTALDLEIRDIANSLAVEFDQKALAVSMNDHLVLFEPNTAYKKNYRLIQRQLESKNVKKNGFRKYLD